MEETNQMEDPPIPRYWCHQCTRMVSAILEEEGIKCPYCTAGFVQELEGDADASDVVAEHAASLWANMIVDMLTGSLNRSAHDDESGSSSGARESQAVGDHVVLVNPFTGAVIFQQGDPNFELLQRYLEGGDTSQYGTPPAEKKAMEGLPTVKVVAGGSSCPVCLDDLEVGSKAKEMPCMHRFHKGCIIPWLEIHGTCPVCRFHLIEGAFVGSGSGGHTMRHHRQRLRWLRALFSGRSRRSGSSPPDS